MAGLLDASAFVLKQSFMSATPLLLAGFGELVAERAGVINVGIEGLMLMGTIAAYSAAVVSGSAQAALPAAAAIGMLLAAVFALVTIWCRSDQVVTGTAINLLAIGGSTTIWRVLQNYMSAKGSDGLPLHPPPALFEPFSFSPRLLLHLEGLPWIVQAPFKVVLPALCDQYGLFYAVAGLGVALWAALKYTRLGLIVQALGDAPDACDAAGIRVRVWRSGCVLFAGACAGAAGAYLSTMRGHSFQVNMTGGQGFLVLALVIFGRWHIAGLVAGTIAFGALDGLQSYLAAFPQATRIVPHQLFEMLPYVATLIALGILTRARAGPAYLGRPWPEER